MNDVATMKTERLRISAERMTERLDAIYECGRQPDGTHARIAYSPEDRRGREVFAAYFRKIGLIPREDSAGNLIVRREGKRKNLPAILIGSHLDTVADGGKYDGAYGCVASLEAMEALTEAGIRTEHAVEMIVFTDEEGVRFGDGMFGSSAFCGTGADSFAPDDLDGAGNRRSEVLKAFGIDLAQAKDARRSRKSVHAFIELHVEQGKNLVCAGHPIGVVSSIAGVLRKEIVIRGEANHAGATMMGDRRDALVAAAACIAKIPELIKMVGGERSVATVGTIRVSPDAVNVIPGVCRFTIEIRDEDMSTIERIASAVCTELEQIVASTGVTVELRELARHAPARMNDWVSAKIKCACATGGYPYSTLPSGAFHDALHMTKVFPTGMIFVPSIGGISHSRYEKTRQEDMAAGAEVLLQTILELDVCKGEKDECI
jgi:allantoate deiminase/N-carbamoyl-L-amino-acid hydrolase